MAEEQPEPAAWRWEVNSYEDVWNVWSVPEDLGDVELERLREKDTVRNVEPLFTLSQVEPALKDERMRGRAGGLDEALEHIDMADGDIEAAKRNIQNLLDGVVENYNLEGERVRERLNEEVGERD